MVFQTFALLPWLTVLQNVELGLEAQRVPPDERKKRALAAIDLIGLDGFETAYPKELSGGMRQRVGLARALHGDPRLIVLDEPNSNLDEEGEKALARALATMKAAGRTVIVVTHRPQLLAYVDRVLVMTFGTALAFGPRDEVIAKMRGQKVVLAHDRAQAA